MSEFTQIELGLVISAKNLADGALNSLRATLESLSGVANSTFSNMAQAESKAQANMQPLVNEMKTVTSEMNSVGRAASEMGAKTVTAGNEAAASGKKMHEFISSAELMLAGSMIESFGQKLLGFFGASVKSAADFDQNMHNVIASLDAMGDHTMKPDQAFKALKQRALDLGMQGAFSANQIGEAMNVMAQQGITSSQILNGAIEITSKVAAANQQDLQHTANVISDVLHQYGNELGKEFGGNLKHQMEGVGDAMTKSLHNGRMSMEDFLSVMRYAGPQAAQMGVSFRDLSGDIAELARHGIKGSQAGTALRTMLINLIPQTDKAAQAFKDLGFTTKDGGNIFLTSSGQMKPMIEVQRILHEHLSKLTPAMQEMALKTIFGRYALSGMTVIANESPDAFKKLISSMSDTGVASEALQEKQKGLGMQIQMMKAHFETFQKEVGDILKPLMVSLLGTVNSLFAAWQQFGKLHPELQKNIVIFGAIAAVVATVVGGLMVLIGTLGMFYSAMVPVVAGIGAFVTAFAPVIAIVVAVIAAIVALYFAWKNNLGGMQTFTSQAMKQIQSVWNTAWNGIRNVVTQVWKYIGPTIISGIQEVQKWWNEVWPMLQKVFQNVWHGIQGILLPAVSVMKILIAGALGYIKGAWDSGWKAVGSALKLAWDLIVGIIRTGWSLASGIWKVSLDLLTGQWSKAWSDVKSTFTNIWNSITGTFGKLLNDALQFGTNFVNMIASGIKGAIGSVTSAVSSVAQEIKHYLGFASPTKMGPAQTSDLWAPAFVRMFSNGIHDTRYLVEDEVNKVALVMQNHLDPSKSTGRVSSVMIQKTNQSVLDIIRKLPGFQTSYTRPTGIDPFLQPESDTAYDRIAGHTSHHPTVSDYIWQPGHTSHHPTKQEIHIHIEGRTMQTDQQLVQKISDHLGRRFRTHLTVATPY